MHKTPDPDCLMAGHRQSPTGAGFDPFPQFSVHEIAGQRPLSVTGRCQFAIVRIGTIFDLLALPGRDPRKPDSCRLLVEEIRCYERPIDALYQVSSARLVLSGDAPPLLAPGSLLVAHSSPDAQRWRLINEMWQLAPE